MPFSIPLALGGLASSLWGFDLCPKCRPRHSHQPRALQDGAGRGQWLIAQDPLTFGVTPRAARQQGLHLRVTQIQIG